MQIYKKENTQQYNILLNKNSKIRVFMIFAMCATGL